MIIETLSENNLLSFSCWVDGLDNHLSPVFIATFSHPSHGAIEAFCKPYHEQSKGLFNEIVGFLIIKNHQLPQPRHAFLAVLSTQSIPSIKRQAKRQYAWLNDYENVICFCTARLDGHSAAIHLNEPINPDLEDALIKEVTAWREYPAAIVNDEIIAHTDRHLNNLIRLKSGDFALIDNGRLISENSENWQLFQLNKNKQYRNLLYDLLPSHTEKRKKIIENCMNSASIFAKIDAEIEKEIVHWAGLLLPSDALMPYLEFQKYRKENAPCLTAHRVEVMI